MGGAVPSGGMLLLFGILPLITGTIFALAFNWEGKLVCLTMLRGVCLFVVGSYAGMLALFGLLYLYVNLFVQ